MEGYLDVIALLQKLLPVQMVQPFLPPFIEGSIYRKGIGKPAPSAPSGGLRL